MGTVPAPGKILSAPTWKLVIKEFSALKMKIPFFLVKSVCSVRFTCSGMCEMKYSGLMMHTLKLRSRKAAQKIQSEFAYGDSKHESARFRQSLDQRCLEYGGASSQFLCRC